MNWEAVQISLKLAGLTALLLLVPAIPLAYWIAFTKWRWKFLVEAMVTLPLILPPTVLGFYILLAVSPKSLPGALYEGWIGRSLAFSFEGLVVASMIYSLPFAVQPLVTAFSAVDRNLVEAAWTLGESRLGTFRRVILPLSVPGLVTAIVLSFAHTIGEFGVVLMVGGNIQGVTRTVSIDIYDRVQALDYESAGRTALLLLLFSFAVLAAVYSLNRRGWLFSPGGRR